MLMYTIWYVRNLVCFKGTTPDVFHALNLIRIWQKSYNLTIYQSHRPPVAKKQYQIWNLPIGDLDFTVNNHLWLKGIRKCNKKAKTSTIKNVLILQGQISEVCSYWHEGLISMNNIL